MGKRGARRWTQEKTGVDREIINDVRYLVNAIKQTISDDGWDMTDVGVFRKIRFELHTSFNEDTIEETQVVKPIVLTYDMEYDFEIEWSEKTRPFKLVTGYFLKNNKNKFEIEIGDFT